MFDHQNLFIILINKVLCWIKFNFFPPRIQWDLIEQKMSKIYWECQDEDQLCGVHCLNSLVQGPYFDEVELSKIALELDEREKNLYGADGQDLQNYTQGISQNVDDDGNFSIQVLLEALKQKFQLQTFPYDKDPAKAHLYGQDHTFLCSTIAHWYAVKRINGVWYNLDSQLDICPEIIDYADMTKYLNNLKDFDLTILAVRGDFPQLSLTHPNFKPDNKRQRLLSPDAILMLQNNLKENRIRKEKKSRKKQPKGKFSQEEFFDGDSEYLPSGYRKKQTQLEKSSQQQYYHSPASSRVPNYDKFFLGQYDENLIQIIVMSLQDKFQKKPLEGQKVYFVLPNGNSYDWVFEEQSKVEDLYDFILNLRLAFHQFVLMSTDGTELLRTEVKLNSYNIKNEDTLLVMPY